MKSQVFFSYVHGSRIFVIFSHSRFGLIVEFEDWDPHTNERLTRRHWNLYILLRKNPLIYLLIYINFLIYL